MSLSPEMMDKPEGGSSSVDEENSSTYRPVASDDAAKANSNNDTENTTITDTTDISPHYSVYWEEEQTPDPENPLNWSETTKWANIGILSILTFLTPLASSMLAPAVPTMLLSFSSSSSSSSSTFVVSIFVLGFATGPLLWAPLSELYGRIPIYHLANTLFLAFTLACGASGTLSQMMAFRFLAGFTGVCVVTCGAGSISDMTRPEKRGKRMAVWSAGPMLGPVVGPVAAGFLVERLGWRWVFWVTGIVTAVTVLASFLVLRETYAPMILERKAARLRRETGDPRYQSRLSQQQQQDGKVSPSSSSKRQLFLDAITRPARLFFQSPVVCVLCVYIAVTYGLLYILFTTFTFVYTDVYGFDAIGSGLSFIAGGVGNFVGLIYVGFWSDRLINQKKKGVERRTSPTPAKKDDEEGQQQQQQQQQEENPPPLRPKPERRLHPTLTVPTTLSLTAGLIMYGWTAQMRLHWILPMIGTGIMGFGMIGIFMAVQTYLVEAFTPYAASVTAANAVLRSILGALLPLCGLQVYDALGLGWGNTLLGFLALVFAPVTWGLYRYGERIRESSRFRLKF